MNDPITLALFILFLPLLGFAIQIFFGRFLPRQGDWAATACIGLAAVFSLMIFFGKVLAQPHGMEPVERQWEWLSVGIGGADLTVHVRTRRPSVL